MARVTYVKVCAFIMVPLSFIAALPSKLTYILVAAIFGFLACITISACVHIFRQHRSKSHNFRSLIQNYLAIMVQRIFGGRMRKRFDREANDCGTVQEKLLMEIVSSNQDTVFGREYNFESIQNSADFIKLVPLTTKDSYKEYVGRPCTLMSLSLQPRGKKLCTFQRGRRSGEHLSCLTGWGYRGLVNFIGYRACKHLKLMARLIGQLRVGNLQIYLPNISTRQN